MAVSQTTVNDCFRVIAEQAKTYLDQARAEDENEDPFALVYDISDGLGQDLAMHVAIQLRAVLYAEGLVPPGRKRDDDRGYTGVALRENL